jgi:hypothetical protein
MRNSLLEPSQNSNVRERHVPQRSCCVCHSACKVRQDQRLGDSDLIPESGNQLPIKQRRLMTEVSHEVSISIG